MSVESTGFIPKLLDDDLSELKTALRSEIDPGLELTATSPEGQLVAIVAERMNRVEELAQAIYNAFDPAAAEDASLDNIGEITGHKRQAATKSTVTGTLNIDAGQTVSAGAVVSVSGNPTARFVLLTDVTNGTGSTDDFPGEFEAETAGAVVANAGTLTVIETPSAGWNTVTNAADAVVGLNQETDTEYRVSREASLTVSGDATLDAIRADILAIAGVTECKGFQNVKDRVIDGLPPKSFEMVVLGGADQDIFDQILGSGGAGIESHGSTSGTAADNEGNSHTVKFTRPTEITVHVDVTVLTDPATFPGDGSDQIKEALRATIEALNIGDDVVINSLYAPILSVSGVLDVTVLELDTVDPPVATTNLSIAAREVADIETTNIDVTVT